jgi:hypothetical protein
MGTVFALATAVGLTAKTADAAQMRRPISPEMPVMMIHADVWNSADPQKIIDLIPEDIRPYVVLNLSLSINHKDGKFITSEYGYSIAKSWLRTAAENRIWATIQPSSGGFTHFPDYPINADLDTTLYGEFFRDYPNFIGINYAEQFWGYDQKATDPMSPDWVDRVAHWANLVKFANKYGGYVLVSFTGGYYGASINPIGMLKRNPKFAEALEKYAENFIIEEKYTMAYGFHDIESVSMGMWLSGYAGQYGIRFDQCGWHGDKGEDFPPSAGAIPYMEHLTLTGETVIDGPELIWQQSIHTMFNGTTADGYTTRRWEYFPQFVNITLEGIRKVLDGTIRILNRKEVIDRTKVVMINDLNNNNAVDTYASPLDYFNGLYKMDGDGDGLKHVSWFKKTGRYPALPTVYKLRDDLAKTFKYQLKHSEYKSKFPNIATKQKYFNDIFPEEYTGDIYAAHSDNVWVTYNPKKTGATASGSIPFQYNTADKIEATYSIYSMGIISEFKDKLKIYATNYDNKNNTGLMTDTFKIHGCSAKPTMSYKDRGSHTKSQVSDAWANNVYTLTVKHNGPLDIDVACSGKNTNRKTEYATGKVTKPDIPSVYKGTRQYEAEYFDFKNIGGNIENGTGRAIRNYEAMGYLNFGTKNNASIRDTVHAAQAGSYTLETRYSNGGSDVKTIDLYVNGKKKETLTFKRTGGESNFSTVKSKIELNAGVNVIMFQANAAAPNNVVFDNIKLTSDTPIESVPPTVKFTSTVSEKIEAGEKIAIAIDAKDSDGSVSHIDFFDNDSLVHSEWTAPYEFDWTPSVVGSHTLKAVAYDNDGNMANASVKVTVAQSAVGIAEAKLGLLRDGVTKYQVFTLQGLFVGEFNSRAIEVENAVKKLNLNKGIYILKPQNKNFKMRKVVVKD